MSGYWDKSVITDRNVPFVLSIGTYIEQNEHNVKPIRIETFYLEENPPIPMEELKKKKRKRGAGRGKDLPPISPDAPFPATARKMREVLEVVGYAATDRDFAVSIGSNKSTVLRWASGTQNVNYMAKLAMSHVYEVPEDWWEQPDVPLESVLGTHKAIPEPIAHFVKILRSAPQNAVTAAALEIWKARVYEDVFLGLTALDPGFARTEQAQRLLSEFSNKRLESSQ